MHVLGFSHEQNRRDRERYIRINYENIRPGVRRNFEIFPDGLLCSHYDYCSVMHYSSTAFSVSTAVLQYCSPQLWFSSVPTSNILQKNYKPTITALGPVVGCSLGQRAGLSELDLRRVNSLYDCRGYQRVELSLEQRVRETVFPVTGGRSEKGLDF